MLNRIKELLREGKDFGFETMLSTKSYVSLWKSAKSMGYSVVLIYFWLESVELAIKRILDRVKKGGHNVPENVIERRYKRGLVNFFFHYQKICDSWLFYNNSYSKPELIASKNSNEISIINDELWAKIILSK